jgi:ligand-binding sensor domain-containing protein/serine phosphatase RsbU (regulator of sigma subunit)
MNKNYFFFTLILNLFVTTLYSQQYFFRRYSIEEGLPQSSVYCLLQDSRRYIWMGTDGAGVSRFDGNKFETFTKLNGLSDNVIRSLFEDSKGNIWIGTDNGLTLYDGFNFTQIGKEKGFKGSSVLRITEGSNGTIWACTNDGGLFGLKLGDSLSITNFSRDDGLISNLIYDIYEDNEKRLWLAMARGMNIVEFSNDSSTLIKKINKLDIQSDFILSIEPGQDGTIWIGTYGNGLYRAFRSQITKNYTVEPSSINVTMPGLIVWDIICRKDGEVWIATDKNGVIKLRNDKIVGKFNRDNGLLSNQILDIMEDNEGNYWFASFGQGAIMFDDEKFLCYSQKEGLTGNLALTILFSSDDFFYVATEEGLTKFRKEDDKIRKLNFFTSGNGLNDVGANTIEKKDNDIWIGTNNGINILDGSKLSKFPLNKDLPDLKINCMHADKNNNMWIGTIGGYSRLSGGKMISLTQNEGLINNEVQTIIEDSKGKFWLGTLGGLVRLDREKYTDFNTEDGLSVLRINCLAEDPAGNIWIGTFGGGIFKFDQDRDTIPISSIATKGILSSNSINSILFINDSLVIAGTDKGFEFIKIDKKQAITNVVHYGINDGFAGGENNPNAVAIDKEGLIWFGTKNGIVRFDPRLDVNYHYSPPTYITGVKLFFEDVDWSSRGFKISKWTKLPENLILSHSDNHVAFEFTGFSYHNPDDLTFSYFLEPQSKEWSPYISDRDIDFPGLTPGNYVFKVKAKNKYGSIGETAKFSFSIRPPFWQTTWFIILSSVLFIVAIIVIIRLRERNLIKEKVKLEKIVVERTREVVEQKDEIARQRDVVTSQKKEITDSIHYAETIQRAVLPEEKILKSAFSDYFILFRPKDIVSGDFYWMTSKKGFIVFAAADCTGHGVPGAFMSMLGVSFLNKIVNESGIVEPSAILTNLRENIISSLKQEGTFETSKDGLDIAICTVDAEQKKLWFAGANNPLYLVRKENNEYVLIEKKGDRMPVGFYSRMTPYINHEIDIRKGDTIYLSSDGFIDQFGGREGRKFMKVRFQQMLLDYQALDMNSQKEAFIKALEEWINYQSDYSASFGQVDDIIVMGVRI